MEFRLKQAHLNTKPRVQLAFTAFINGSNLAGNDCDSCELYMHTAHFAQQKQFNSTTKTQMIKLLFHLLSLWQMCST